MKGIKSIAGDRPVFLGCTTTGIVTNNFLSYNGVLAGGAFISTSSPFFNLFTEENIKDREFEAGVGLAKKIRASENIGER